MSTTKLRSAACVLLALAAASVQPVAFAQKKEPGTFGDSFDKLQRLMAPGPEDSQWMQVPWMPSSNIYAARKKAAAEGKPLLLWYMAGEPLGTC